MTNHEAGRTLDAGALKALAHPLRVRIYDLLSERGAQTASTLASLIGETSGSTSYHLRALAAHDLIREVPGKGTGRERWWERPKGRVNLPAPSDATSAAERAASQIVNAEFFARRHETLLEYLNRPNDAASEPWRDASLIVSTNFDITIEQMTALRQEVLDVVDAAVERYRGQKSASTRRVALRLDLFDLPTTANTPEEDS